MNFSLLSSKARGRAVPLDATRAHEALDLSRAMRLLSVTVILAAGVISCSGVVPPLTVKTSPPFDSIPEYSFQGDESYGDYDLTDNFWPEFNKVKNIPLAGSIGRFRLSNLYEALFCSGENYGGRCRLHDGGTDEWVDLPSAEPAPRSIEIHRKSQLEWTTFSETTQYPVEAHVEWSNKGQGIASDSDHWYFTNDESIYKVPVSSDTGEKNKYITSASNPFKSDGFNHVGDPDYDHTNDLLIIPLEIQGPGGNALGTARRFVAFSPTLQYVFHKDIRPSDPGGNQGVGAWVAINPLNGLLYTGPFDGCSQIFVYKLLDPDDPDPEFKIFVKPAYTILLDKTLSRVQGGAFSVNGHLYLASDAFDNTHGIYGFQIQGRRAKHKVTINFRKDTHYIMGYYNGDEVEGIDVWNMPSHGHHSTVSGQIHLMVVNVELFDDQFSMKHFSAADSEHL